jgi:hypothetical protein
MILIIIEGQRCNFVTVSDCWLTTAIQFDQERKPEPINLDFFRKISFDLGAVRERSGAEPPREKPHTMRSSGRELRKERDGSGRAPRVFFSLSRLVWKGRIHGWKRIERDFGKFWLIVEIPPPQCPLFLFIPLIPKQALEDDPAYSQNPGMRPIFSTFRGVLLP